VDQNAIPDPAERKAIGLTHPSSHRARVTLQMTRERLEVCIVGQKVFDVVGHVCTVASSE